MKRLGKFIQENDCTEEIIFTNNQLTNHSVDILSEYLIGNTTLKRLDLVLNLAITDASVPHILEVIKKSCITELNLAYRSISDAKVQEIEEALKIPLDQREIPIQSNSKSAAKISPL